MSSSDRRTFLTLLATAPVLAACGFEPAYAPGGGVGQLLNRVAIDPPADKNAFDLVERLEDRLGRPDAPAYRLSYRIATRRVGLAITPENAITRYNVNGTVAFALREIGGERLLAEGEVASFTSYAASGTPVATLTAEEDAYERLMRILADQLVARLIASSGSWAP